MVFFAALRVPSRIKERCSPRPFVDKERCSPRPFVDKERCSSRPFVRKVFFACLRGSKKGVLRAPSRAFADQRKVFFAPLRVPSRIKERCSSRPFVVLRTAALRLRGSKKGVLRAPSRAFADQRKVFFAALRGPSWTKKVFTAPLRVPSRTELWRSKHETQQRADYAV